VDGKIIQIEEEQLKTQEPDFWENPKSAEEQLKKVARLKSWVDGYHSVESAVDDLNVLSEFLEAGESSEKEVEEQYLLTLTLIEGLESKTCFRTKPTASGLS
jgi:peptide chain release factor 2